MSSDHDIMRLPDAPPPAPDARAAAVQQALVRFDQKSAGDSQGMPTGIRPHRANRRALAAVTREDCHKSHAISPGCQPGLCCCRIGRLSPSHAVAAAAGRRCARRTEGGQQRSRSSSFDRASKKGERRRGQFANANPGRHGSGKAQPASRRASGCRGAASRQAARGRSDRAPVPSERAFRDAVLGLDGSHAGSTAAFFRSWPSCGPD